MSRSLQRRIERHFRKLTDIVQKSHIAFLSEYKPTFDNYIKHLRILIKDHNLPIDNPTIEDFGHALKSRGRGLAAATVNTAIVVARKFAEFRGLDADSREMLRYSGLRE